MENSSGLVTFVLPVLAAILLVEGLLQSGIVHARHWVDRFVLAATEKRRGLTQARNIPRR